MSEKKNDQPDEAEVQVTEEAEASESNEAEAAESSEAEAAESSEASESNEAEASDSSEAEASDSSEAEASESNEAEASDSSEAEASDSSEAEASDSSEAEASDSNEAEASDSSEAEASASGEAVSAEPEEFVWPSDPEHANAAQLLSEPVEGVDMILSDEALTRPSYALNLVLLVLVLGVGGVGVDMLREYSSADRDARMKEQALCRVEHNDMQQLLAEKQYGALRLESEPKGAKIERSVNGAPYEVVRGKTASGEEIDALTPTTVSNLDINNTYKFRLTFTDTLKRFKEEEEDKKGKKAKGKKAKEEAKAEGEKKEREVEELKVAYRTEEFYVARYQWIQDGATGAFRTQKVSQLVPQDIAHYYTFDWKSGKDLTFETLAECEAHVNDSDATICRAIPAVKNWDTEDARREEEAKKSKKRGRRRRR